MIIYRLKNELREHWKLVLLFWVTVVAQVMGVWLWWVEDVGERSDLPDVLMSVGMLMSGVMIAVLCYVVFKRDDLKDPEAFWATRPVRALPMFLAKFVFLQLVVTLPLAVLAGVMDGVFGDAGLAVANGVEVVLWGVFLTGLLGLSGMARSGFTKVYWVAGLFVVGVIGVIVLLNSDFDVYLSRWVVSDAEARNNLLIMLVMMGVVVVLGILWQLRNRHRMVQWPLPLLLGVAVTLVVAFVRFPMVVGGGVESVGAGVEVKEEVGIEAHYASQTLRDGVLGYDFIYRVDVSGVLQGKSDCAVVGGELEAVDGDFPGFLNFKPQGISRAALNGGGVRSAWMDLEVGVYGRRVSRNGGYSSSSLDLKRFDEVERKSVRVTGYLDVEVWDYREIYRGSLDEEFVCRRGGLVWRYEPNRKSSRRRYEGSAVIRKRFNLPLVTSARDLGQNVLWFAVRDPLTKSTIGQDTFGGSSSGRGGVYGSIWEKEFDLEQIEDRYEWRQLEEAGEVGSFEEWRERAELVVMERTESRVVRVPVDVVILVPDSEVLLKMSGE